MDAFIEFISPFALAILQGMTEFLPVSSSGHLILLNAIFDTDLGIVFDIVLHVATLVSVVVFYRKDIASICIGCIKECKSSHDKPDKPNLKLVAALLLATAITGTIGLLLNDFVESKLRSTLIVGALLIVNAGILWISQKKGALRLTADGQLNFKTAALIGLAQGFAVLPGISRSGSTITTALLLGVRGEDCAKISFLLSIPIILGAAILHLRDLSSVDHLDLPIILGAAVLASVTGYFCLILLDKMLKKAHFHRFAPYCIVVGLIAIVAHFVA